MGSAGSDAAVASSSTPTSGGASIGPVTPSRTPPGAPGHPGATHVSTTPIVRPSWLRRSSRPTTTEISAGACPRQCAAVTTARGATSVPTHVLPGGPPGGGLPPPLIATTHGSSALVTGPFPATGGIADAGQ